MKEQLSDLPLNGNVTRQSVERKVSIMPLRHRSAFNGNRAAFQRAGTPSLNYLNAAQFGKLKIAQLHTEITEFDLA